MSIFLFPLLIMLTFQSCTSNDEIVEYPIIESEAVVSSENIERYVICGTENNFIIYDNESEEAYILVIKGDVSSLDYNHNYNILEIRNKVSITYDYYLEGVFSLDYCSDIKIMNNVIENFETNLGSGIFRKEAKDNHIEFNIWMKEIKFYNNIKRDSIFIDSVTLKKGIINKGFLLG